MPHRYVLKDDYWKMRIEHPYSMLCASDYLATSCGQAPIGEYGDVLFPGDLLAQSDQVIAVMDRILNDAELKRHDLERIVVFTSENDAVSRNKCVQKFRDQAPQGATVFPVQLPPLFYDDLLLEVDYYVVPGRKPDASVKSFCIECPVDRKAGSVSDAQRTQLKNAMESSLQSRQLGVENVVKLSCFAPTDSPGFWDALGVVTAQWFGNNPPALSEVVSDAVPGDNTLVIDVTCMTNPDWGEKRIIGKCLERGQPEAVRAGPLLFTSALFVNSSTTRDSLSVAQEVDSIMQRHAELLAGEGFEFADVIKATTFYDGAGSADALHENMSARNAYYEVPGPGSTGLPVSGFPYAEKRTSIELIAAKR